MYVQIPPIFHPTCDLEIALSPGPFPAFQCCMLATLKTGNRPGNNAIPEIRILKTVLLNEEVEVHVNIIARDGEPSC